MNKQRKKSKVANKKKRKKWKISFLKGNVKSDRKEQMMKFYNNVINNKTEILLMKHKENLWECKGITEYTKEQIERTKHKIQQRRPNKSEHQK